MMNYLKPSGKIIIENPLLQDKEVISTDDYIHVWDLYKFTIGLWGARDDILDICFSHARAKVKEVINKY